MAGNATKRAIAMELIAPADSEKFLAKFVAQLKKRCVMISAVHAARSPSDTGSVTEHAVFDVVAEGTENAVEVYWNHRLGFWFCHRVLEGGHSLGFGMDDPQEHSRLRSIYELAIPASGFDGKAGGGLVRFGNDVFLAHAGRPDTHKRSVDKLQFRNFLSFHGYDLVQASVELSGNKSVDMILLSSASDGNAGLNMYKFIRAVRDFEQWQALDLLRPQEGELAPGASPLCEGAAPERVCGHNPPCPPLHAKVVASLREHLETGIRTRNSACTLGASAQHDILMFATSGVVAAVFQVKTDIAPQSLFCGAGELLLSRALRARKVLVVPQDLGPFFTQALHRQGLEVATYIFSEKGIVFIDIDRVLESFATTL